MSNISKTICFVCYGNICRSPMAVAIMRDIIMQNTRLSTRNIQLCSAGTGAIAGHPAHPNSKETMNEWGLNIDDHVSTPLTADIVDSSDLIVALDSYVKKDILRSFPKSKQKVILIDIADPYGHSIVAYRHCAEQIKDKCISDILPMLV